MSDDEIEWDKERLERLHEKIEGSEVFLSLFSQGYKEDPSALVQLAFEMMLDKPIYIIAQEGERIPKAFMKIADGIEYYKDKDDITRAVKKLVRESKMQ